MNLWFLMIGSYQMFRQFSKKVRKLKLSTTVQSTLLICKIFESSLQDFIYNHLKKYQLLAKYHGF